MEVMVSSKQADRIPGTLIDDSTGSDSKIGAPTDDIQCSSTPSTADRSPGTIINESTGSDSIIGAPTDDIQFYAIDR